MMKKLSMVAGLGMVAATATAVYMMQNKSAERKAKRSARSALNALSDFLGRS